MLSTLLQKLPTVLIALCLNFLSSDLHSQDKLQEYKNKSDSIIAEQTDNSFATTIKLVDLFVSFADNTKSGFLEYKSHKDRRIKFRTVSFFYEFYSYSLDYSFRFSIVLNADKSLGSKLPLFEGIPNCVLLNKPCYFITKDSAIKVAIKDSILYQDNLKVLLIPENKKDIYYWAVYGSPKMDKKSSIKPNYEKQRQRRIINAISGIIIRRD